jgi:hypothetical protein
MESLKEKLDKEYVVLATSLSPGMALSALVNTNDQRFKDISVTDLPMPKSKQEIQELHLEKESLQVKKVVKKSIICTLQAQEEEEEGIDLKKEKRAIAIADLFERKRLEYHEQGREEIKKHLIRSKQRLSKLEKSLKLSSNRTKVTKKKLELPLHLQNGANNNFKVDESLKSCWYDKVAEMYLMKRGNHRKEKVAIPVVQVKVDHAPQKKAIKEIPPVPKSFLTNVLDAPEMASLSTAIQMNDETIYYYTKYDQHFRSEKLNGKIRYKQVMDQVARAKEVTLNALVRNGISVLEPINSEIVEENVPINIMEDDVMIDDEKDNLNQRMKSFGARKSFTEYSNTEKLSRRSYILPRKNSTRSNDAGSPVEDAASYLLDDTITCSGLNQSFNQQIDLNSSFRLMAIRNPQINEKIQDSTLNVQLMDNIQPSDMVSSLNNQEVVEKPIKKKVIEPLTWDEMVEIERPKLTVPEKVPLMKWHNPNFK